VKLDHSLPSNADVKNDGVTSVLLHISSLLVLS
jgi:hypothetical protein